MSAARVLHVTTVHPAFDGRIFGMQAKSLAAAGFDVTLATTVDAAGERDGVKLFPLGALKGAGRRRDRIVRNFRAFRLMQKPWDIIHFHDPELLVAAGLAERMFGRSIVYDVHEYYDEKFAGGDVTASWIPKPLLTAVRSSYGRAESAVLPRAAGVVVVSDAMVERYRRYLPSERVAVVQNFPNFTQQEVAAARALPRLLDVPYAIHTGGASRDRVFDVIVGAAERLQARGDTLRIVNLGPVQLEAYPVAEQRSLLRRAEAAGIVLPGSVPQAEALRWLAHARVGYLPLWDSENNRRGQPRKLFEYLLFGLPVVASDVGNIAKLVRRHDVGIVVPDADPEMHAETLARLLADAPLHEYYVSKAQGAAKAFSFQSQLPNLLALYERILASKDVRVGRSDELRRLRTVDGDLSAFQNHSTADDDRVTIAQ